MNQWEERYKHYKAQGLDRFSIIIAETKRNQERLKQRLEKTEQEETEQGKARQEDKEKREDK